LAIQTGWTLEYIENLPFEIFAELKALNSWKPFTYEREANQLGLIAQLLHNQNIDRKHRHHAKTASEIFPYLKNEIPEHLEDERVLKVRKILSSFSNAPEEVRAANLNSVMNKVREEVEIEKAKEYPDHYVIDRLSKIIEGATND